MKMLGSMSWLEKVLLVFSISISFFFLIFTPPFQKTDEVVHYYKTLAVATGQFYCSDHGEDLPSNTIAEYLYAFPEFMQYEKVKDSHTQPFPSSLYSLSLSTKYDTSSMTEETVSCALIFIPYVVSGLILALPVALDFNPLILFYIGRIAFFITSIVVLGYAINIIPKKYRPILLAIIARPMVLIQIGSYNKEVFHIIFGLLTFSYVCAFREGSIKKSPLHISIYILSIILSIIPRPQFLPFLLLILYPFADQIRLIGPFVKKNMYGITLVIISGFILFVLAIKNFLPAISIHTELTYEKEKATYPALQLQYLLDYPEVIPGIVSKTYFWHVDAYWKSLSGVYGWLHYYLDWHIYIFFGFLLFYLTLRHSKQNARLRWYETSGIVGMTLATTLFIAFLMYLFATPVANDNIMDIQGRYFIIMTPYVVLLGAYLFGYHKKLLFLFLVFIIAISLMRNIHDRYYNYSHLTQSDVQNRNLESIQKSIPVTEPTRIKVQLDERNLLKGLYFYSRTPEGQKTNKPYEFILADTTCETVLAKQVLSGKSIPSDGFFSIIFNDTISDLPDTICITLQPYQNAVIDKYIFFASTSDSSDDILVEPIYGM